LLAELSRLSRGIITPLLGVEFDSRACPGVNTRD
jgi:hypothetical protein